MSFETNNRAKRFCSEKCRRKAEKRRWKVRKLHAVQQRHYEGTGLRPRERFCKTCDTKFTIKKYNGEKYCSESCRVIGYEERKAVARETARKRYYNNKQPQRLNCEWCGSSFESYAKVKYCSNNCRKEKATHSRRLNTYNLSEGEYESLLVRSGGLCEICQEKEFEHIDHCHTTGDVRGLLCQQCNHGLGNFQDRVAVLNRASEYLSKKVTNKN